MTAKFAAGYLASIFTYAMVGWFIAVLHKTPRGAPGFGVWVWLWPVYLPLVCLGKWYRQKRSDLSDWFNRKLYDFIGTNEDETAQETPEPEPAKKPKRACSEPAQRDPQSEVFETIPQRRAPVSA